MSEKHPGADDTRPPRLKRETLRGLGFQELDQVHGGKHHDVPGRSRYCLGEPK